MMKRRFTPYQYHRDRDFLRRLELACCVTGIILVVAGVAVRFAAVKGFDLIPSDSEQALRVMAIWNVMMYFVPGVMIISGLALGLFTPLFMLLYSEFGRLLTRLRGRGTEQD